MTRVKLGTLARAMALVALVAMLVVLTPGGASAHERRDLTGGKYQFVVGFLNEPALQNQPNSLDLTVTDMTQKDAAGKGAPVEGLEKTLKAEVLVPSGAKKDLTVVTRFGMPGKYAGYFVPTQPGQFMFHIFGTIGDQKVDEMFQSGPGRFSDVDELTAQQFPNKIVVPTDLQAQLTAAKNDATGARTFGIAGLVVGVLGLAAGGAALATRGSRRPTR